MLNTTPEKCTLSTIEMYTSSPNAHLIWSAENQELFELCPEDLHQLYMKMHEDVPEAMDYQLRRRAILNGDEWVMSDKILDRKTENLFLQTGKRQSR